MVIMPVWLLKYLFILVGFGVFIDEGQIYGLVLGIIGLLWCIYSWTRPKK